LPSIAVGVAVISVTAGGASHIPTIL
jgi:hypothetical protein